MKTVVYILMVVSIIGACGKTTEKGGAKKPNKTEDELQQVEDKLQQIEADLRESNERLQKHDKRYQDRQNAIKKCEENDEKLRVMKQENEDFLAVANSLANLGPLTVTQRLIIKDSLDEIENVYVSSLSICPRDKVLNDTQKAIDEIKNVLDEYTQQGLALPKVETPTEVEPVVYVTTDDAGILRCYLCNHYDRTKCRERLQSKELEETSCPSPR